MPMLPQYGGCKSWIDIEQDVSTEGASPVLSDEAFALKLGEFHGAVRKEGLPTLAG